MNCKNCGTFLPEGSVFCNKCGEPTGKLDFSSKKYVRKQTMKNVLKIAAMWVVVGALLLVYYFNFTTDAVTKNMVTNYIKAVKEGGDLAEFRRDGSTFPDLEYIYSFSDVSIENKHKVKDVLVFDEKWFEEEKASGRITEGTFEDALNELKQMVNDANDDEVQLVKQSNEGLIYTTKYVYTQYIIGVTLHALDVNGKEIKQRVSFIIDNYNKDAYKKEEGQAMTASNFNVGEYRIVDIIYEKAEDLDEKYYQEVRKSDFDI